MHGWPGAILIPALCARGAAAGVLIGMAGPLTGSNAWYGEQLERGAAQALADLNAAGGVLGQQVQLITADDSAIPIRRSRRPASWSAPA